MKISIISPIKNCENTIERTINSIINEKKKGFDIEYIIIDGNSMDKTLNIIDKYKEYIDVFKSENDKSVHDAINKGIELATGDYILSIASGDILLNNAIKGFISTCKKNIDVWTGATIRKINGFNMYYPSHNLDELYYWSSIFHPATFFHRNSYKKFGYYDPELRLGGDRDLFLKFYTSGASFQIEDLPIVYFAEGGMSQHPSREIYDTEVLISTRYGMDFEKARKNFYVDLGLKRKIKDFIWKILDIFNIKNLIVDMRDKSNHRKLTKNEINEYGLVF